MRGNGRRLLAGDTSSMNYRFTALRTDGSPVEVGVSARSPYPLGLGMEKALTQIKRGRGTFYDTDVSNPWLCVFRHKGDREVA
ncbi:MAG: hypothetical protein A3H32_04760 [Betaproteobacteria bacterium RIFCSPLOWO2_02_FULL_63_19]|nr:MAG: hypothetical protein A3H32_04760 [Betaproteobacteria bacterium RIFCSPLOWO2_02_FULL_63_19]